MNFSLRTLLIMTLVLPPALAGSWRACQYFMPGWGTELFIAAWAALAFSFAVDCFTRLRSPQD